MLSDDISPLSVITALFLVMPLQFLAYSEIDILQISNTTFFKNQFQVWDLGGQTSIRPYWRCYYPNTDAIIFVVDSADAERMSVARGELAAMLEEDELRDAILLVFANKQDQKGALNAQQISDALGLPEVRNRQWSIQETSALQGKGLFEGFDWLVSSIKGTEE